MLDFERNNKTTGIYWLKQPVEDLKIKIKLKPRASIVTLPKYEEFVNATTTVDLERIETDRVEEFVFKWQEKVFSAREIKHYKDSHNCVGDLDLAYHDMLKAAEYVPQKVFTYINDDYAVPLPLDWKKYNAYDKGIIDLNSCLERINLDERIGGILEDSSSMRHLFRSNENIASKKEQWIAMHVVFDDSLYTDDFELLRKQEYVLFSLYYNIIENYILTTPDVNDVIQNPYNMMTETGTSIYQYGVEIMFEELESDEELVKLLNQLYKKWEKKQEQLMNFAPPPLGKKKIYLSFEIHSAMDFDLDNIYIDYEIKIPEDIKCDSTLRGRTHISKGLNLDDSLHWSYGHIIELDFEISTEIDSPPLQMFFEAISVDWWERHRTEGYYYLPLFLNPGHFTKQLSCCRPEEKVRIVAENRRFFVGGCHLIKDLEVLSKPQLQNANFTYTETGKIDVRWSTVIQAHIPGAAPMSPQPGSSSASALLQGAEAVLRQYSQARARLAAATKDLGNGDG